MRAIYDPPELCQAIEAAPAGERVRLMKQSTVRRGEQGRGAQEPDLVTPSPWWFELQWAGPDKYRPMTKFSQAVQDVADHRGTSPWTKPVAICQLKGSPFVNVWLYLADLCRAVGGSAGDCFGDTVVSLDYSTFVLALRAELKETRWQQARRQDG